MKYSNFKIDEDYNKLLTFLSYKESIVILTIQAKFNWEFSANYILKLIKMGVQKREIKLEHTRKGDCNFKKYWVKRLYRRGKKKEVQVG